jgi:hypothetical protein
MELTIDRLKEVLKYDPVSGKLFWAKKISVKVVVGAEAGNAYKGTGKSLYLRVGIFGKSYGAHNLAWAIYYGTWPEGELDHKDLDGLNNAIDNLRDGTHQNNACNIGIQANNTTGFKGVSKKKGKYRAYINKSGKQYHLGTYATPEEAHVVYCLAAKELHGEFARVA